MTCSNNSTLSTEKTWDFHPHWLTWRRCWQATKSDALFKREASFHLLQFIFHVCLLKKSEAEVKKPHKWPSEALCCRRVGWNKQHVNEIFKFWIFFSLERGVNSEGQVFYSWTPVEGSVSFQDLIKDLYELASSVHEYKGLMLSKNFNSLNIKLPVFWLTGCLSAPPKAHCGNDSQGT